MLHTLCPSFMVIAQNHPELKVSSQNHLYKILQKWPWISLTIATMCNEHPLLLLRLWLYMWLTLQSQSFCSLNNCNSVAYIKLFHSSVFKTHREGGEIQNRGGRNIFFNLLLKLFIVKVTHITYLKGHQMLQCRYTLHWNFDETLFYVDLVLMKPCFMCL